MLAPVIEAADVGWNHRRLKILGVATALLILPALASPGASVPNVEYELYIDCPGANLEFSIFTDCPIRIHDSDDILGSPSVAVDPRRAKSLMVASLHGGDADGPTNRSRGDGLSPLQLITTHLSRNEGESWEDCPWMPPQDIRNSGTYGEHTQMVTDEQGRLYVAALYSIEDSSQPGGYASAIWAQKYRNIAHSTNTYCDGTQEAPLRRGDYNAKPIDLVEDTNVVDQFWIVYDPATGTSTIVWGEHPPRASQEGSSQDALPLLAEAAEAIAGTVPPLASDVRSVIGHAWTTTELEDDYTTIKKADAIGPCRSTTNAVLAAGKIYIGCLVDPTEAEYPWDTDAVPGQLDLFRFSPKGGRPEYLGTVPIDPGGRPLLGVRNDNRIAVVSAMLDGGQVRLTTVYGQGSVLRDMQWSKPHQYGADVTALVAGRSVLNVDVQDVLYREPSGVVHFILKFRFARPEVDLPPSVPLQLQISYAKFLIAADEDHGVLKTFNLNIGTPANRSNFATVQPPYQSTQAQEDVFDDLTDDIFQLPPKAGFVFREKELPDDYQREYYAVGDYGDIQFAEIVEVTNLRYTPAGPVAAQIAIPSAALSVAGIVAAASSSVLVGLFALRMALRRATTAAATMQK